MEKAVRRIGVFTSGGDVYKRQVLAGGEIMVSDGQVVKQPYIS